MRIVEGGKPVTVLDSPLFSYHCQITDPPSLVQLANFYKTYDTFLYVTFFVFASLHMSPISLYQFVNLLGRFSKRVLHPNLLLN